jgi:ArsR family transcriptional regulator
MDSRVTDILKAAGEPTRLRILNLLRQGSICVCDLQAVLGLPQPTVSRHLAALRHAGLVLDFRDGPRVLYSLAPATTTQTKLFYEFLNGVCACEAVLRKDLKTLGKAVSQGECALLGRKPTPEERIESQVQHGE